MKLKFVRKLKEEGEGNDNDEIEGGTYMGRGKGNDD